MSLQTHLTLGTSILTVDSPEPGRVLDLVIEHSPKSVYMYSKMFGLKVYVADKQDWKYCIKIVQDPETGQHFPVVIGTAPFSSFGEAIQEVRDNEGALVILDAHTMADQILDLYNDLYLSYRTTLKRDDSDFYKMQMIMVTSQLDKFPKELRALGRQLEIETCGREGYESVLDTFLEGMEFEVDESTRGEIVSNARGLFELDFLHACVDSYIEEKTVNPRTVYAAKLQSLKDNASLELRKPTMTLSDVGGLDNAKILIERMAWTFANPNKVEELGIEPIRRVMLVGVAGCGKSMICESAAHALALELAKGGISQSLSKWVGESEQNMRNTFKYLRYLAPVVFWIDEFGRDLSGSGSSNDSGTTDRVQGEFLTGLQELPNNVFLFAAANNIAQLPPEMTRAERFDDILFVGFPTLNERIEIFKMNLKHDEDYDYERLGKITHSFTGAEIKAAVKEARFTAAVTEQRPPTMDELVRSAKSLKNRIWINKQSEIQEMYARARTEWHWASSEQEQEAQKYIASSTSGSPDKKTITTPTRQANQGSVWT